MSKATVLIVEDEAIVAADISDSLEHLGYRVCGIATSGTEAVAKAMETKPELVLMDIELRGEIDGIAAAAAIRNQVDTPVVYLTAHCDDGTLERAKNTLPAGYVLKPFAETELRIALELALFRYRTIGKKPEGSLPSTISHPAVQAGLEAINGPDFDTSNASNLSSKPSPASAAKTQAEILNYLIQIRPFNKLDRDRLQQISAGCHVAHYSSGEIILHENDQSGRGFLVCSGRISLLKTSASGRQLIVELLPPGDLFGLAICLDQQVFPLTARVQRRSELLWIPRDVFRRFLEVYPKVYEDLVSMIAERLRRSYSLSRALAHDRVEVRIASALAALVPRFGAVDASKGVAKIAITRQELADLTGTSVETAIRICKNMERENILELSESGTVYITDQNKLAGIFAD